MGSGGGNNNGTGTGGIVGDATAMGKGLFGGLAADLGGKNGGFSAPGPGDIDTAGHYQGDGSGGMFSNSTFNIGTRRGDIPPAYGTPDDPYVAPTPTPFSYTPANYTTMGNTGMGYNTAYGYSANPYQVNSSVGYLNNMLSSQPQPMYNPMPTQYSFGGYQPPPAYGGGYGGGMSGKGGAPRSPMSYGYQPSYTPSTNPYSAYSNPYAGNMYGGINTNPQQNAFGLYSSPQPMQQPAQQPSMSSKGGRPTTGRAGKGGAQTAPSPKGGAQTVMY